MQQIPKEFVFLLIFLSHFSHIKKKTKSVLSNIYTVNWIYKACFVSIAKTLYKSEKNKQNSQNELSSPIRSFLCPITILACKQCIFWRFKV